MLYTVLYVMHIFLVFREAAGYRVPSRVKKSSMSFSIFSFGVAGLRLALFVAFLTSAYRIRLYAIHEYGRIIHEFDPWFNFRATQYLADNGWTAFFSWFDHMSWYPLGRPVGSTIYPGMQITSVLIWRGLQMVGAPMSLNDVCVFVPVWFGVFASALLGLFTWECGGCATTAVLATGIMAVVPAHIMRSVGGGYDNESVAMTAMILTFYLWIRSLRNQNSWFIGAIAGLAYVYMVAVWGGYVFVLNLIGLHAIILAVQKTVLNEDIFPLQRAFTLFYVIGTFGAIQVPVVGWSPLKSLEQLAPFFFCIALQLLAVIQYLRYKHSMTAAQVHILAPAAKTIMQFQIGVDRVRNVYASFPSELFSTHTSTLSQISTILSRSMTCASRCSAAP